MHESAHLDELMEILSVQFIIIKTKKEYSPVFRDKIRHFASQTIHRVHAGIWKFNLIPCKTFLRPLHTC